MADGAGGWPAWNAAEFRVRYASLAPQLCVSGIYVKLLLDGLDQAGTLPYGVLLAFRVSASLAPQLCVFGHLR